MSSKKYFDKSSKILEQSDINKVGKAAESDGYIREFVKDKDRFVPHVDFSSASNFAFYGLAEKYYEDSITRVYKTYPYDGSLKEKLEWDLSSSYLDKWIFDKKYPRTHGWANIGFHWGGLKATIEEYGAPVTSSYEYISFKGGPNIGFLPDGDRDSNRIGFDPLHSKVKYSNANIYDTSANRSSNLQFNLSGAYSGSDNGLTVEFWMKKNGFNTALTKKEVIFDLWNQKSKHNPRYGRLTIEMSGVDNQDVLSHGRSDSSFYFTLQSGSSGVFNTPIGSGTLVHTSSIGDNTWNHYAFTFASSSGPLPQDADLGNNTGSVEAKFYINGKLNDHILTGSSVSNVTGALVGYIGALQTAPSGVFDIGPTTADLMSGYGKLYSASLDEFRFWKVRRTSEDIGRHYNTQVGGGTNTDAANTNLGVYFKFNEGITQTGSVDNTVLDYSGRVSNGSWTGYSQANTPRQTGSAILESSASSTEFKDPIIYSFHRDITSLKTEMKYSGSHHDVSNPSNIYKSIPSWIIEDEEQREGDVLKNLTQIIASYFDTLQLQVENLTRIRDVDYNGKYKPLPFASRLLESMGFVAPEIAADANVLEQFLQRDDNKNIFKEKLHNVKNFIYQNIYNNLAYIYKSKGTENSFRNLIRCFGVDEELIKINLYADGATHEFKDNYKSSVVKERFINFSDVEHTGAVVFQATGSSNLTNLANNSYGFISGSVALPTAVGSKDFDYIPFTIECEVLFPKIELPESTYFYSRPVSASLFGMHTASAHGTDAVNVGIHDKTWLGKPDYPNFQVFAVKGTGSNKQDAKFVLTGTAPTYFPSISSDSFRDVYNNEKWNFAVRLKHEKYPIFQYQKDWTRKGYTAEEGDYTLEFYGVNSTLDKIENEFVVSSSITADNAKVILNSAKSLYVGAHRENFTGSILYKSDVKVSSFRYWLDYLPNHVIQAHSFDATNFGIERPYENAYLLINDLSGVYVPRHETLVLHWDFNQITGSDEKGNFFIEDVSSGTVDPKGQYSWFGNVANRRHTGYGFGFKPGNTGSISQEYIYTAKKQLPEVLNSSDMISILPSDVELFSKSARPSKYFFAIEKSMYQVVSEEMLKMISSIKEFNNLIGMPVDKYRSEYKNLKKLRRYFFEKIGNIPDLDKFIDFYKWLDNAISDMIMQLAPASAKFSEGMRNTVESHIFERNKYQHKFPFIDLKTATEGRVEGAGKRSFAWSKGHHPIIGGTDPGSSNLQSLNGLYWQRRAELDQHPALVSSLSATNFAKARLQDSLNTVYDAKDTTPYAFGSHGEPEKAVSAGRAIHGGINFSSNKKLDYRRKNNDPFGAHIFPMVNAPLNVLLHFATDLVTPKDPFGQLVKEASTNPVPGSLNNKPRKVGFYNRDELKYKFRVQSQRETDIEGYTGEQLSPFNIYSSSVDTGYNADVWNNFNTGVAITNLHHDTYGPDQEEPMQGPFTYAHVGGNQHRHVPLNKYSGSKETPHRLDTHLTRPEGFKVMVGYGALGVVDPHYPGGGFDGYNDPRAKKALYYRDETAKRPINIRNIQSVTGTQVLGNYIQNYEVVQMSARSIQNRYFVKNSGVTASYEKSSFISGVVDYLLPNRTGPQIKTKSVFVNRFSAPGGPDASSGFLDIESGEYSVYNALPFRNLNVRQPLRELLSRHCNQFGSSSVVNGPSASFHKVNRNTRYKIKFDSYTPKGPEFYNYKTASIHDNVFITRPIPQSDLQYSWITASAIVADGIMGDRDANEGFAKLRNDIPFGYTTASFTDGIHRGIEFVSASDFQSFNSNDDPVGRTFGVFGSLGRDQKYQTDFAGINSNIYEPVTSSKNHLGYGNDASIVKYINTDATEASASSTGFINTFIEGAGDQPGAAAGLNALILHRQGAYGWPIFKQIQTGRHPVARYQKRNNIISVLNDVEVLRNFEKTKIRLTRPLKGSDHSNFIEPVFTTKYLPMEHEVVSADKKMFINHTYGNKLGGFANERLSEKLQFKPTENIFYNTVRKSYTDNTIGDLNPLRKFVSLTYRENVYPKGKFIGLNKSRMRENYTEEIGYGKEGYDRKADDRRTFWSNVQRSQTSSATPALNALGIETIRNNFWPLGNKYRFTFNVYASGSQVITATINSGSYQGEISPLPLFLGTGSNKDLCIVPMAEQVGMAQYFSGTLGDIGLGSALHAMGANVAPHGFRSASLGFAAVHVDAIPLHGADQGMINYYHRPTASLDFVYLPLLQSKHSEFTGAHPTEYVYPYNIPEQAGKNPWYDSYEDYASDIRYMAKDHTILPEFRMSDHMEYYVKDKGGEFLATNRNYLRLDGGEYVSSSLHQSSSFDMDFFHVYSHSDFLKNFGLVSYEHDAINAKSSRITLTCEGVKKLLPYNGFYPVTRTVQLASLLSQSIGPHISGGLHPTDDSSRNALGVDRPGQRKALQSLMRVYFAPGIMYNTIKSGIAVDFPVITGTATQLLDGSAFRQEPVKDSRVPGEKDGQVLTIPPNFRIPFEAMVDIKNSVPSKTSITLADPDKLMLHASGTSRSPTSDPDSLGRTNGLSIIRMTWNGKKDSLFEMASNNFLAEIPKFFLQQRGMRTFASKPEKDFKTMEKDKRYEMDIRLHKTDKFDMIRSYFSASTFGNDTTPRSYHGRYFGPPYQFTSGNYDDVTSRHVRALNYSDPAYAPFTPPYFYGDAIARIAFTPKSTRKYGLDEIFASSEVSYLNTAKVSSSIPVYARSSEFDDDGIFRKFNLTQFPSASEQGMMHISSSVNIFGTTQLKKVTLDAVTGQPKTVEDPEASEFNSWVISSKFECPVLNFYNVRPTEPSVGATGMWATYGEIPSGSEGIFLTIEESTKELEGYGQPKAANTGSLLDVVGLRPGRQRIGEIAQKTKIEEAIVAIPFLSRISSDVPVVNIEGKNFIAIDKAIYHRQKKNLESGFPAVKKEDYEELDLQNNVSETSISKMIKLMDKYYFPPFMDFSTFASPDPLNTEKGREKNEFGIDPFVIYMFEFSSELDKQDLADIWQGVMAKPMMKAEKEVSSFSHPMEEWEFFHGKDLPEDVRWMVFKVKRKAEKSYFDMTADQSDDARFKFNFKVGEKRPEYNYNWPYDFCSLVELAKIGAEIEIAPDKKTMDDNDSGIPPKPS